MILRVTGGMHTAMNMDILAALLQEAQRDEDLDAYRTQLLWMTQSAAAAMLGADSQVPDYDTLFGAAPPAADRQMLAARLRRRTDDDRAEKA